MRTPGPPLLKTCEGCGDPFGGNPPSRWAAQRFCGHSCRVDGIGRGESHPGAKLTARAVRDARYSYREGLHNMPFLARAFGVSETTIRQAIIGDTWRHVS